MEENHTIPLRKQCLKVPRYKRTQKAIKAIREYSIKHSKNENIKIGKYLNLRIWEHGMKNPPPRIKVKLIKKDDHVIVELHDVKIEEDKKDVKKGKIVEKPKEVKKEEVKKDETKKAITKVPEHKKEVESEEHKDISKAELVKETIYPRTKKTKNE